MNFFNKILRNQFYISILNVGPRGQKRYIILENVRREEKYDVILYSRYERAGELAFIFSSWEGASRNYANYLLKSSHAANWFAVLITYLFTKEEEEGDKEEVLCSKSYIASERQLNVHV